MILDTGETLPVEHMSGSQLSASRINVGESVEQDAQVVVIRFAPLQKGQTLRLRITETYAAPVSYKLAGDELVFDRSLGRPRNAVVLPSGWYCTYSAAPATVTQLPDGRVRLDYWNDRPEDVDVLLKARRRVSGTEPTDDKEFADSRLPAPRGGLDYCEAFLIVFEATFDISPCAPSLVKAATAKYQVPEDSGDPGSWSDWDRKR